MAQAVAHLIGSEEVTGSNPVVSFFCTHIYISERRSDMGFTLTTENIATLLIDGSAIFLLAGVYIVTYIMRMRGRQDDRLFSLMLGLNMILALADIVTYLSDEKDFPGARYFNMGGVSVFYIVMVLLIMVFLHYSLVRFRGMTKDVSPGLRLLFLPGLITEFVLIINFFTGLVFSVDKSNIYHYGVLFVPMLLVMGFYAFVSFYVIQKYHKAGDGRSLIPVWIYFVPLTVGMLPFAVGGISITSIGIAMSIVFTHCGSASEMVNSDFEEVKG